MQIVRPAVEHPGRQQYTRVFRVFRVRDSVPGVLSVRLVFRVFRMPTDGRDETDETCIPAVFCSVFSSYVSRCFQC